MLNFPAPKQGPKKSYKSKTNSYLKENQVGRFFMRDTRQVPKWERTDELSDHGFSSYSCTALRR